MNTLNQTNQTHTNCIKIKPAVTLSVFKFFNKFTDEATSVKFIEEQIWADGIICPYCDSERTTPRPARLGHRCCDCRKDFTVRTGTIFENSRLPLRTWLYAMHLSQTSRKGISSMQLSKELGVTQKSAWFLLQRIREACGNNKILKLTGIVEVDETYIGGKEANKHQHKKLKAGRGAVGKQAIIGAKERNGNVVAKVIDNTKGSTLKGFIAQSVANQSTVFTDDFRGYNGLLGFNHKTVKHSAKEFVNGMAHTNGIESVWAVLKRGYNGVYHNWSIKHTKRYVDEFVFRLNEGNCRIDTQDRMDSLFLSMHGKTITYNELTG